MIEFMSKHGDKVVVSGSKLRQAARLATGLQADMIRKMAEAASAAPSAFDMDFSLLRQWPTVNDVMENISKIDWGPSDSELIANFALAMESPSPSSELRKIAKELYGDRFPHGFYHGLPVPSRRRLHVRRRSEYR